jgi:hypothetical protein
MGIKPHNIVSIFCIFYYSCNVQATDYHGILCIPMVQCFQFLVGKPAVSEVLYGSYLFEENAMTGSEKRS